MLRKTLVIASLVTLALSATVSNSAENGKADTATIVFKKNYDRGVGLGRGTRQLYFHLPRESCEGKKKLAAFSGLTGDEKSIEMPAGQPVKFWAFTEFFNMGYSTLCQHSFTFVPRAGDIYEISLKTAVETHCAVDVYEKMSGAEPPDISYDLETRCK